MSKYLIHIEKPNGGMEAKSFYEWEMIVAVAKAALDRGNHVHIKYIHEANH